MALSSARRCALQRPLQQQQQQRWRAAALDRAVRARPSARARPAGRLRAQEPDGPDGEIESLFAQELKRRGMERGSQDESAEPSAARKDASATTTASKSPFDGAQPGRASRPRVPPAGADGGGLDGQRERSMAMVTEGLEGLPGRAGALLQLGGSVFLAFLPFMLAFSALFTAVWLSPLGGDNFLHGGTARSGPPTYVSPEQLLGEPTVDPYIPIMRQAP